MTNKPVHALYLNLTQLDEEGNLKDRLRFSEGEPPKEIERVVELTEEQYALMRIFANHAPDLCVLFDIGELAANIARSNNFHKPDIKREENALCVCLSKDNLQIWSVFPASEKDLIQWESMAETYTLVGIQNEYTDCFACIPIRRMLSSVITKVAAVAMAARKFRGVLKKTGIIPETETKPEGS